MNRAPVFAFAVTTVLVLLALVSLAVADPDGWAAWRVALAAWPLGIMFGAIAAFIAVIIKEDNE